MLKVEIIFGNGLEKPENSRRRSENGSEVFGEGSPVEVQVVRSDSQWSLMVLEVMRGGRRQVADGFASGARWFPAVRKGFASDASPSATVREALQRVNDNKICQTNRNIRFVQDHFSENT